MKKLILTLLLSSIMLVGCDIHKVADKNVDEILQSVLYDDNKLVNTYMNGYELYLPKGINVLDKKDYNLNIKDQKNNYYLYVDTIAYYYQEENTYEEKSDHFYSRKFNYQGKSGFIDIIEHDKYYFVVLMYNYAKIETFISKDDLSISLVNMGSILNSIKYNDKIIKENVGTDGSTFKEEKFNIFESKAENDNFLKYEEEYGTYKDKIVIPNKDNDVLELDEVVE